MSKQPRLRHVSSIEPARKSHRSVYTAAAVPRKADPVEVYGHDNDIHLSRVRYSSLTAELEDDELDREYVWMRDREFLQWDGCVPLR